MQVKAILPFARTGNATYKAHDRKTLRAPTNLRLLRRMSQNPRY